MEVVNPFILKNKERMIVFLDQLSSVTDPNPPAGSYIESSTSSSPDTGNQSTLQTTPTKSFIPSAVMLIKKNVFLTFSGRELATLHHICVTYLPELQRLAKTNASIKKLVTVTDMLTKHKLKYREMIS